WRPGPGRAGPGDPEAAPVSGPAAREPGRIGALRWSSADRSAWVRDPDRKKPSTVGVTERGWRVDDRGLAQAWTRLRSTSTRMADMAATLAAGSSGSQTRGPSVPDQIGRASCRE